MHITTSGKEGRIQRGPAQDSALGFFCEFMDERHLLNFPKLSIRTFHVDAPEVINYIWITLNKQE